MSSFSLYVRADTWCHRVHPAIRLASASLLFVVFLAFNDPRYMLVCTALAVLLLLSAGGGRVLLRMLPFLTTLLVVAAAMWAFFLEDELARKMQPVWNLGPVSASRGTVLFGIAMGLRIVGMVVVGLLVIATTPPEELSYGLRALGVPPLIAQATALSFYLLPLLVGTALTVRQAQEARGLELRRVPFWTRFVRSIAVIGPVTGYALRRADDLTRALELAGMGTRRPSYLYQRRVAAGEWLILAAVLGVAIASVMARMCCGYGQLLPRL
ncbi:MAG: energy-coupling factor transporter transmembrane protein EcfT [Armatimonadetes bacterium]|nr:energy-coupling factor transporter transmembrane protein EcfT [Armatimonadota bacterium]